MATPPKPVTDNVITAAWGGAVHDKLFATAWYRHSGSTDGSAYVYITPALLGLSVINGGLMVIEGQFNATDTLWISECRVSSGQLAGRVVIGYTATNNFDFLMSTPVIVNAFAWGIPA